jgi:hypothetical protein
MDRRARFALLVVVALCVLYVGAAALVVPGIAKYDDMMRSNRLPKEVVAPSFAISYLARDIWMRFDTVWYLEIAADGYHDVARIVFYPLYPLLIRALSATGLNPLTAALIISRLATFFLLWGLLKLLELDYTEKQARLAALLMMFWPSGFMLLAAYPDSLVLAFSVWAFYFARRDQMWLAGLTAALAGGTKAAGAAVLVGLVAMAWKQKKWHWGALALAAAGNIAYPAWLWLNNLPPATWVYARFWRTTTALPWDTLLAAVLAIVGFIEPLVSIDLVFFLVIAWLALRRRTNWGYAVYAGTLLLLFLMKKTDPLLQSTSRYLLAVFPAFAELPGRLSNRYALATVASVFVLLHATALSLFWWWWLVV